MENVDYDGVNMLYITKSEEVIYNSLQIIWTNGPAFEYPPKDLALALGSSCSVKQNCYTFFAIA